MCSYILKEIKHESLIDELCVFNRHQWGEGYIICIKIKGPYN
nr:MAG TPA: hypothetical protein [Bacteriophage sp.]